MCVKRLMLLCSIMSFCLVAAPLQAQSNSTSNQEPGLTNAQQKKCKKLNKIESKYPKLIEQIKKQAAKLQAKRDRLLKKAESLSEQSENLSSDSTLVCREPVPVPPGNDFIPGDCAPSDDGQLDIADAVSISSHAVGKTNAAPSRGCDFDGDGRIEISDSKALLDYLFPSQ